MGVTGERTRGVLELPLLPLRGMLVYPHMVVNLDAGRPGSVAAVRAASAHNQLIVLATQRDAGIDVPRPQDLYETGCLAAIRQISELPGGSVRVLVEGLVRVHLISFLQEAPEIWVQAEKIEERPSGSPEELATVRQVQSLFGTYAKLTANVSEESQKAVREIADPGHLADTVAAYLNTTIEEKQALLETVNPLARLTLVARFISKEIEVLQVERRINQRVKRQIERGQKEYYLREQLKAIREELGDADETSEADRYRDQLMSLNIDPEVKARIMIEVERLEKLPPMAAEGAVIRNYLDWILALPWDRETPDQIDIEKARAVLDQDHYGLEKAKERILEFLAVRKLSESPKGPILCLVGPPGVGKTSLARAVAQATGRQFVRVSLGGIRDEAEIRGHRRTYVGAMPGRIIQGMRQAGTRNPVFLLDEIDKMSMDFRGDPSAALLEALDPEQNRNFSDHFIEVPFDLSRVMFITTANSLWNVPRALVDRMEVIAIPGYTEDEKVQIAKRHIIPKVMRENGVHSEQLGISDGAIRKIIRSYTREMGVRGLEREIAKICRHVAVDVVEGKRNKTRVTVTSLEHILGVPPFRYDRGAVADEVGVVTGVAVTDFGGDIMPIEVTAMRGKGGLYLTGKIGEVMRESAQAGYSYIRSHAAELGVDEDFFEKYDLHVHIPEGAIPKEGPSAGVALLTAMISALTGRPVRHDVAMTGEITLRGRVLAIGGLKDKALGAYRAGIRDMIVPAENRRDLDDIPSNIRRKMHFRLVENVDEVLSVALRPAVPMMPVETMPAAARAEVSVQ